MSNKEYRLVLLLSVLQIGSEKCWFGKRISGILSDMEKKIIQKIQNIIGRVNVLTTAEECSCYSYDASGHNSLPDAVALPETTEQVSALLKLADKYRFPVIPRGAGSGTTGGALPIAGGLVLGFSRMNRILEIDPVNMIAVVEPGVITGELRTALKKYGLTRPDLSVNSPKRRTPSSNASSINSLLYPRIFFVFRCLSDGGFCMMSAVNPISDRIMTQE